MHRFDSVTKIFISCVFVLVPGVGGHVASQDNITYHFVDGDIILGAMFPIHKQGGNNNTSSCGQIQREDGIQPFAALLFTIDEINNKSDLLPNIKLGIKAFDSCDNPYYASKQSLNLLKGFIFRELNASDAVCKGHSSTNEEWPCDDKIVGLVGPQTSPVSIEVGSLSRLFHVPQVSYLATSVALCDSKRFPYFFRTVPSDLHQAKAIVQLLKELKIEYASIVYSDSEYGEKGYQKLKKLLASDNSTCLGKPIVINKERFKEQNYSHVIDELSRRMTRVVIVFADRSPAGKLLSAAKNMTKKFIWIGSDAWASKESVVNGNEDVVDGAIGIQPLRRPLPGFDEYFSSLIANGNSSPLFGKYSDFYAIDDENGNKAYFQQLYIHFVRDAVYAFAHAIDELYKKTCSDTIGGTKMCNTFKTSVFNNLSDYLQDVSFQDVDDMPFKFFRDDHGSHDGLPRYTIIHFRRNNETGRHDWINVGTYYHNNSIKWDEEFNFTSMPYMFLNYGHPWARGAITLASFGMTLTVVTAIVLCVYWNTPVVMACGRELSMLLLFGTFLSFSATFAIVAKPSNYTCGIMRFSIGFCYTVCYSAVVTKTNRVSRIFKAANNLQLTSPLSTLFIAGILILLDVIINVIWLIYEPPDTQLTGTPEKLTLMCQGVDHRLFIALLYPFLLIMFATVYAFQTRKCPGGFNETRLIFFANSVTCIHWVAYVPLYFISTNVEVKAIILAFSLSLNGLIQIACLLLPKTYTVLFKPQKNTRFGVMAQYKASAPGDSAFLQPPRVRCHSFHVPPPSSNNLAGDSSSTLNTNILLTQRSLNSYLASGDNDRQLSTLPEGGNNEPDSLTRLEPEEPHDISNSHRPSN